ncbi:MAG TPA: PP2C family protein-serine/threonine phosphatase [Thermoanaerobaculia bacterium]|nr:PP2C family protein-serine/threonine phosphatase [Thermoanaerobaculia bacterium]
MRTSRDLLLWTLAGLAGVLLLAWAYPRAFPFLSANRSVNRGEAAAIALERLTDLGDPVPDPYVVTAVNRNFFLERRLHLALDSGDSMEKLQASGLPKRIANWQVFVYPKTGQREEWVYEASVSSSGEVLSLRHQLDPQAPGRTISPEQARQRAGAFLAEQGFDLSRFAEPNLRTRELAARTDTEVRYPDRTAAPSGKGAHGIAVLFSGDRLSGFVPWYDDPAERELERSLQPAQFAGFARLLAAYLLVAVLGAPFLKRYHEGEIGVKRGSQVFAAVALAGLMLVLLTARTDAQNVGFGVATRQQTTWMVGVITMVFWVLPFAVLSFIGWCVGESVCRERWGHKLAAFDALFQRQWGTATVARSALRGVAGGLALAGLLAAVLLALRGAGASPLIALFQAGDTRFPSLELLAQVVTYGLSPILAIVLCVLPMTAKAAKRAGIAVGILVALAAGAAIVFPASTVVPVRWGFLVAMLAVLGPVLVFLRADLLAALLTGLVSQVLLLGFPMLLSDDTTLRVHGWLAVALAAAPLIVSLRSLRSGREFHYRYEDVPPHVRRIAERERQHVELDTARRIQSSILPELPPSLYGVEIAHAYLPASEVGGDFYDVLALEDGRLAVAVGDVAGHGVSSGLVMSMAKSALAVQVTFDPEVAAVFNTLNRTVFQTARKRLLATLCYALLDPQKRELVYASAGHLFPYRITAAGQVEALESIAYPLGVRGQLEVEPRTTSLAPGDTLFLFSDGLIEARPEGSDQLYGFERLEQSLARHARRSVEGLRDGVLEDVERHAGYGLREDDQTILVLRLP